MTSRSTENEGRIFGPGIGHVGGGVIGFGVGTESYVPLAKVIAPMESVEKSAQKAFELLRVNFDSENEVIDKVRGHINKVAEHVRTKVSPLVELYYSLDEDLDRLEGLKDKSERSEAEQRKIEELREERFKVREETDEIADELGMVDVSEVLNPQDQVALILEVLDAHGKNKYPQDGRNKVGFRLGLLSEDPGAENTFQIASLTIAEADVFTGEIIPVIHSPEHERGVEESFKDIIPILIASPQSLPKPKTG